jgi:hypothetical protein
MSERVTWTSCPNCGELAAVGWVDATVVEVVCTAGCELTDEQVADVRQRSDPPPEDLEREA